MVFQAKTVFRVADLSQRKALTFEIAPLRSELEQLAQQIGVIAIKKLRFSGTIAAAGKKDWKVSGMLGATVTQPCVVTLDPVNSRIDVPIERIYLADFRAPEDEEFEITDDENVEPLTESIDLAAVLTESLALSLPLYPRSEGAKIAEMNFTEPGKEAMTDEDARPFAGLAALRDQIGKKDQN